MHPAEQIAIIIGRIYRSGMTTTSGGNLSIVDGNGDMWITPAGIDKGSLKPSDQVSQTLLSPKPLIGLQHLCRTSNATYLTF